MCTLYRAFLSLRWSITHNFYLEICWYFHLGCSRVYNGYNAIHGLGGEAMPSVANEAECRTSCSLNPKCLAYDIDMSMSSLTLCWVLITPAFSKESASTSLTHYNYTDSCVSESIYCLSMNFHRWISIDTQRIVNLLNVLLVYDLYDTNNPLNEKS